MSRTLIIIDLINDISGEHGRSNASYSQVKARQIIAKTNQAVSFARSQNIPIIWVKVGFADDYHDIPPFSPLFNNAKRIGALQLSDSGCDWVDGLDVQEQDKIIVKKAVSAFTGNDLDDYLTKQGFEHIYLGGVSSLMAIQSTARQAHDLGYKVTVLEDLCAAATQEIHEQSMSALQALAEISSAKIWQNL